MIAGWENRPQRIKDLELELEEICKKIAHERIMLMAMSCIKKELENSKDEA